MSVFQTSLARRRLPPTNNSSRVQHSVSSSGVLSKLCVCARERVIKRMRMRAHTQVKFNFPHTDGLYEWGARRPHYVQLGNQCSLSFLSSRLAAHGYVLLQVDWWDALFVTGLSVFMCMYVLACVRVCMHARTHARTHTCTRVTACVPTLHSTCASGGLCCRADL